MPWSCLSGRPPTIMILKSHSKRVDKSSSFRPKINFIKIAPEKGPSRMGKLTNSYNLKKINPKLAKEWPPTKNGDLTPKNTLPDSNKKRWWQCKKGHDWKAYVFARNKGTGCPRCLRIKISFALYRTKKLN